MAEAAPARSSGLIGSGDENLRKSSKHRDGTTSKKRHRNSSHIEKGERKHKKSRKDTTPAELIEGDEAPKQKRKGHKSSKATDSHIHRAQSPDETTAAADADENDGDNGVKQIEKKKKKKHKKESDEPKKSKKSKKKSKESHDEVLDDDIFEHPDVVVLASARSKKFPSARPPKHPYPFYTQTVSQYLALHPLGINEPLQGYMNQHLEPLLNRYVPSFGGVLLAYRNPRIGESPGSGSLTQDSGMDDIVVLESINEHAVNFGWLTVEIDIFRPSRGAWLEGLVNIQSGGHIGVVCWGKFNASIEYERLPQDWQWVDQHPNGNVEAAPETPSSSESSPEEDPEVEHAEAHSTGYWVDGEGSRITADTPICFRIKNYEVGSSGDYGYLSIEGTMLTEEMEEEKVHKEIEALKRKLKQGSVLRRERRPLSELGITKFGDDDEPEK